MMKLKVIKEEDMTRSAEYYKNRINLLKHRAKDNSAIIRKLERKLRKTEQNEPITQSEE